MQISSDGINSFRIAGPVTTLQFDEGRECADFICSLVPALLLEVERNCTEFMCFDMAGPVTAHCKQNCRIDPLTLRVALRFLSGCENNLGRKHPVRLKEVSFTFKGFQKFDLLYTFL